MSRCWRCARGQYHRVLDTRQSPIQHAARWEASSAPQKVRSPRNPPRLHHPRAHAAPGASGESVVTLSVPEVLGIICGRREVACGDQSTSARSIEGLTRWRRGARTKHVVQVRLS
jgi:hypothetical protein